MSARIATIACAGVLLSALASGLITYAAVITRLDHALALRPPIAVVDYGPIGTRLNQGTPARELEPVFAILKATSGRLREHGYLVLNRAAADAVPATYLIPASLTADALAAAAPRLPQLAPAARPEFVIEGDDAAAIIRSLTSSPGSAP